MVGVLRDRQKQLLRHLLRNKPGLSVDELSRNLAVTRTAVRQHLAVLMRDGFVGPGATRPSRGRARLGRIASAVAAQLRNRFSETKSRRQKVRHLAALMDELGYDAHLAKDVGQSLLHLCRCRRI